MLNIRDILQKFPFFAIFIIIIIGYKTLRLSGILESSIFGFEGNPLRGRVKLVHKGA